MPKEEIYETAYVTVDEPVDNIFYAFKEGGEWKAEFSTGNLHPLSLINMKKYSPLTLRELEALEKVVSISPLILILMN